MGNSVGGGNSAGFDIVGVTENREMYVYKSMVGSRVTNAHHIINSALTGLRSPAGPRRLRNSDAHKRIAVPRLSAFFESTLGQGPKAANYTFLIPGPGMFVNVRNAPRVVIPPPSETAPVSACKPLCAILLAKASVYPPQPLETNVAAFVSEVLKAV